MPTSARVGDVRTVDPMDTRRVEQAAVPRTTIRVDCIARTDRAAPHYRIRAIGGTGRDGVPWRLSEEAAIAAIENERATFYVLLPRGRRVDIVVGQGLGKTYLRTEADGESPELLLSLPDCG
jgi:Protein of unknown function (DUF3892)